MFRKIILAAVTCVLAGPAPAQFLDAASVKPILEATKGSWIAVRRWDGKDLLYFTHLLAWRCGLDKVMFGINTDQENTEFALHPCDEAAANPNAINTNLPIWVTYPLDSIETITIKLIYDDGSDRIQFYDRKNVETP